MYTFLHMLCKLVRFWPHLSNEFGPGHNHYLYQQLTSMKPHHAIAQSAFPMIAHTRVNVLSTHLSDSTQVNYIFLRVCQHG